MKHSYDDDIDDDLNRFCEDMDSELNMLSGSGQESHSPSQSSPPHKPSNKTSTQFTEKQIPNNNTEKQEKNNNANNNTVAASPWGMSLFSSFASSATKSLSASFNPLAKDMSSISALASSATKAFSDSLSGAPDTTASSGRNDLTAMAQTPEALEKLRRIQAEHDAERSVMTYACLIASRSAREIAVPARSVTEVPVTVPAGQEISWKFQVKHYDILFGVKLRVQRADGSGEWTEHLLVPLDRITSDDLIDESCCSERCARKFIFTLDNNIAMMYSKTVAFDIILTDDRDWKQQQQQQQQQQGQHPHSQPHGGDEEELEEDHSTEDQRTYHQSASDVDLDVETNASANANTHVHPDVSYLNQDQHHNHDQGYDQGYDHEQDYTPPARDEEWSMYHNDDGQAYFYNNYTEECQWEMPPGFVPNSSDGGRDEGLGEQQQYQYQPDTEQQQLHVQHQEEQVEDEDEADAMAALMLKLSSGFKAGHITAEQRQGFMADIIDCRDLTEMHRELNAIFDQCAARESGSQHASSTIV